MSSSALRLAIGMLAAIIVSAQVGGPQPGRGTGLPPLPRIGGKKKSGKGSKIDESKVLIEGIRGTLRKLDDKRIILFTEDKRFVEIEREDETRFLKTAEDAKIADFIPGVQIWIEGYRDEESVFHALRVNWEKAPTDAERAAAMGPLPQSVRFEDDRPAAEIAKETKSEGPPKMARKDDPKPAAETPAPKPPIPLEEPAEVRERGTLVVEKNADLIPAPKVKRGRPAPRPKDPDDDVAEPTIAASGAVSPIPVEAPKVATQPEQLDPLIEKAREIALEFAETLPNYLAKQVTTRFAGNGKKDRWDAQDNFTADVVYQDGKESYRNVLLNGKPAKGKIEQTGAWSRGEFGTTLRDLMSPATNAKFKLRGNTTISNRRAKLYDYVVEQESSHWQIGVPGQTYFPSYKGSVWIDIETSRVMRIEMQGRQIPQAFPVDAVESAVEWDFVKIGASSYLVPVHAETLSCLRSMGQCSKNVMDFRNYRKFGAQSELILDQPQ